MACPRREDGAKDRGKTRHANEMSSERERKINSKISNQPFQILAKNGNQECVRQQLSFLL